MDQPVDLSSLSTATTVDSLSDRFEAAWKGGERPRIEDYLRLAAAEIRGPLLKALFLYELITRRRPFDGSFAEVLGQILA